MFTVKFVCTKCNLEKDPTEFKKVPTKRGHSTKCKDCYKIYNKDYRGGDKGRDQRLRCRYSISLTEVTELYFLQNGRCKICNTPKASSGYEGLHVDHCHTTNKVRGLLCNECNMMLGLAKDNSEILTKAINYLKRD